MTHYFKLLHKTMTQQRVEGKGPVYEETQTNYNHKPGVRVGAEAEGGGLIKQTENIW